MYLDQEQQGMIKRVLVMRQQHCGTPYQTMQGVFQLLGSSSFLSLTGISQKLYLFAVCFKYAFLLMCCACLCAFIYACLLFMLWDSLSWLA